MLSASFALCYSVSQVQFVLFMKLLPKLASLDAPKAAREFEDAMRAERTSPLPGTVEAADSKDSSIAVRAYRVSDKTLAGKTIGDIRTARRRVSPSSSCAAGPTGSRSMTVRPLPQATKS